MIIIYTFPPFFIHMRKIQNWNYIMQMVFTYTKNCGLGIEK